MSATGQLMTEPVLLVEKASKLTELNGEYAITDPAGNSLGAARQTGGTTGNRAARLLFEGRHGSELSVADAAGEVLLVLTQAGKRGRARVEIADGAGAVIGAIAQLTFRRLTIEAGDAEVGRIEADDRHANAFGIHDANGAELARIAKTTRGLAKKLFTKGESYTLEIHRPLDAPLRSLVVASPLALDIALPRDAPGQELLNAFGN